MNTRRDSTGRNSHDRRRSALIGAAIATLAALALAGCAAQSAPSARAGASTVGQAAHRSGGQSPAATTRHTVRPYDASGRLTVATQRTVTGTCWTTSIAAPSTHTYRCFAANQILDPCFAAADTAQPTTVACLATPSSEATVLRLTKPLPTATAGGSGRVWALQLANGARCTAATGTVPRVAGTSLDYLCSNGAAATLSDPAARVVTSRYARTTSGHAALQRVVVTAFWRA